MSSLYTELRTICQMYGIDEMAQEDLNRVLKKYILPVYASTHLSPLMNKEQKAKIKQYSLRQTVDKLMYTMADKLTIVEDDQGGLGTRIIVSAYMVLDAEQLKKVKESDNENNYRN